MTYEERVKQEIGWLLDAGEWSSRKTAVHIVAMEAKAIREYANGFAAPNYTEDYLKRNGYIPEKEEERTFLCDMCNKILPIEQCHYPVGRASYCEGCVETHNCSE